MGRINHPPECVFTDRLTGLQKNDRIITDILQMDTQLSLKNHVHCLIGLTGDKKHLIREKDPDVAMFEKPPYGFNADVLKDVQASQVLRPEKVGRISSSDVRCFHPRLVC